MKIALLPSTQWGNPVLGGGSEAQYASDTCIRLQALLVPLCECRVFAGNNDSNSIGARSAVAWGANFCLSLHTDAGYDYDSHNAALSCYQEDKTKPLASFILIHYCKKMGFTPRGVKQRTPGGSGVAVLRIPEASGIPAALLEYCWHDRNPDAKDLRQDWFRQKVAIALCDILVAYFNLKAPEKEEEDMPRFEKLERPDLVSTYVYGCAKLGVDKTVDILVEGPDHDYTVSLFIQPQGLVNKDAPDDKIIKVGGWGNTDGNIGSTFTPKGEFPNFPYGTCRMAVHSPVPLALEVS